MLLVPASAVLCPFSMCCDTELDLPVYHSAGCLPPDVEVSLIFEE